MGAVFGVVLGLLSLLWLSTWVLQIAVWVMVLAARAAVLAVVVATAVLCLAVQGGLLSGRAIVRAVRRGLNRRHVPAPALRHPGL